MVLLVLALIPANYFPIAYSRAPWQKYQAGRAIMLLAVSLGLILDLSALAIFFGLDYPGRAVLRTIVWAMVVISLWYLSITYWTLRRQGRLDQDLVKNAPDILPPPRQRYGDQIDLDGRVDGQAP